MWIDVPPITDTSPGTEIVDGFLTSNIGNDFCIPNPLATTGTDIRCRQDPNFIQLGEPVTSWSFNGVLIDLDSFSDPFFFINIPTQQNGVLSIDSPLALDPAMFVGEYVCNRTTRFGQDSERTVLGTVPGTCVSLSLYWVYINHKFKS